MQFFAVNGKRPIRLSEETRLFAYESINHKYGKETWDNPCISMDDYCGFEGLTPLEQYNATVERVVKTAPLRICKGERISGAATLGIAMRHRMPASFKDNQGIFYSVSHLTVDFETLLKKGINYIQSQAEAGLKRHMGTEREPFARSCLHCLECMRLWHTRYLNQLNDMPEYIDNYKNLQKVPFQPASSFYEAVQSLWFCFAFLRLFGNWPGIGRIDWLLGDYLEKDLTEGRLTLDEAREILAHFFIKGCEWVRGGDYGSGDAQHYQNILLGGVDEQGRDVTNKVTYLVLDILEELGISDFPTTVRVNKYTDGKLLNRVAEVIRLGGGVIAVYNEDLIIQSLVDYGHDLAEARKFANDGCWEVQIPGKTFFTYIPFDGLQVLQQATLDNHSGEACFSNFDDLYKAYIKDLKNKVLQLVAARTEYSFVPNPSSPNEWKWASDTPCTVISLFEQGCIEKGLSYLEGGPIYNLLSPHIGGLPDVVNSLYAIKRLVFEDKKLTFHQLMEAVRNDWEGNEALRQYLLNHYTYFGNDNDEVDTIAKNLIEDFADICDEVSETRGYKTPGGISTFGRQLEWSPMRSATAYGKKAHSILSGNLSPTPGTDKEGATAIIKSYCKANLKRMVSGAALDIKLLPSTVNGENGIEAISSLIKGFAFLGGHFMQLDIADAELLKRAQEHPEEYQSLSVRVSGWNARFVTLNREWQDMIIQQRLGEL